eukprot:CFRG7102T1
MYCVKDDTKDGSALASTGTLMSNVDGLAGKLTKCTPSGEIMRAFITSVLREDVMTHSFITECIKKRRLHDVSIMSISDRSAPNQLLWMNEHGTNLAHTAGLSNKNENVEATFVPFGRVHRNRSIQDIRNGSQELCGIANIPRLRHFHYETCSFAHAVMLEITQSREDCLETSDKYGNRHALFEVVVRCGIESWRLKRTLRDFQELDLQIHFCLTPRHHSRLMDLMSLKCSATASPADFEFARIQLNQYMMRFTEFLVPSGPMVACGVILSWLALDEKGRMLSDRTKSVSAINIPAFAFGTAVLAHEADDSNKELSIKVGDQIAVIDMREDELDGLWLVKLNLVTGLVPSACVALIDSGRATLPQDVPNYKCKEITKKRATRHSKSKSKAIIMRPTIEHSVTMRGPDSESGLFAKIENHDPNPLLIPQSKEKGKPSNTAHRANTTLPVLARRGERNLLSALTQSNNDTAIGAALVTTEFTAKTPGEISLKIGTGVSLLEANISESMWKGKNSICEVGKFPQNCVSVITKETLGAGEATSGISNKSHYGSLSSTSGSTKEFNDHCTSIPSTASGRTLLARFNRYFSGSSASSSAKKYKSVGESTPSHTTTAHKECTTFNRTTDRAIMAGEDDHSQDIASGNATYDQNYNRTPVVSTSTQAADKAEIGKNFNISFGDSSSEVDLGFREVNEGNGLVLPSYGELLTGEPDIKIETCKLQCDDVSDIGAMTNQTCKQEGSMNDLDVGPHANTFNSPTQTTMASSASQSSKSIELVSNAEEYCETPALATLMSPSKKVMSEPTSKPSEISYTYQTVAPELISNDFQYKDCEKRRRTRGYFQRKLDTLLRYRPDRSELRRSGRLEVPNVFGADLELYVEDGPSDLPVIVTRCITLVEEIGLIEGIYRMSGATLVVQKLRAAIEQDDETPELTIQGHKDIHVVSSLLKLYFRELPTPVIPYFMFEQIKQCMDGEKADRVKRIRVLISQLPPVRYALLKRFMLHLVMVVEANESTQMTVNNIAIVWGPNLLRPLDSRPMDALSHMRTQVNLCQLLIDSYADVFVIPPIKEMTSEGIATTGMAVGRLACEDFDETEDVGFIMDEGELSEDDVLVSKPIVNAKRVTVSVARAKENISEKEKTEFELDEESWSESSGWEGQYDDDEYVLEQTDINEEGFEGEYEVAQEYVADDGFNPFESEVDIVDKCELAYSNLGPAVCSNATETEECTYVGDAQVVEENAGLTCSKSEHKTKSDSETSIRQENESKRASFDVESMVYKCISKSPTRGTTRTTEGIAGCKAASGAVDLIGQFNMQSTKYQREENSNVDPSVNETRGNRDSVEEVANPFDSEIPCTRVGNVKALASRFNTTEPETIQSTSIYKDVGRSPTYLVSKRNVETIKVNRPVHASYLNKSPEGHDIHVGENETVPVDNRDHLHENEITDFLSCGEDEDEQGSLPETESDENENWSALMTVPPPKSYFFIESGVVCASPEIAGIGSKAS